MIVPEAWVEAAHAGFVEAWRLMASLEPAGAVAEVDGLALAATGLPISGCNTAMAITPPVDPAGSLDAARQFFANRRLPWVLYATGNAATAILPHIDRAGLRPSQAEPAMFLLPEDSRTAVPPPGFTVRQVEDAEMMDVYRATAARGFETGEEGFRIWARHELLGTPGLRFYLGLLDGKPAATSCVYVLHGIATINMVSTIPAHRRKGLGELMTWRAIDDGFTLGAHAAFLHASRMGYPVYQRMGFRHVFTYQTWVHR